MRIGQKSHLVCPPELAYGSEGAGGAIPGNSGLLFTVELVDIVQKAPVVEKKEPVKEEPKKEEAAAIDVSQFKVNIVREGSGVPLKKGDTVSAHYRGTLVDGTIFDTSYERGQPIKFTVG